jgi:hypothetical protein
MAKEFDANKPYLFAPWGGKMKGKRPIGDHHSSFEQFAECVKRECSNEQMAEAHTMLRNQINTHDGSLTINDDVFRAASRGNVTAVVLMEYGLWTVKHLRQRLHDADAENDRLLRELKASYDERLAEQLAQYAFNAGPMNSFQETQLEQSHPNTMAAAQSAPSVRLHAGSLGSPMPRRSPSSLRATIARIATISSHTPGGRTSSAHCGGT